MIEFRFYKWKLFRVLLVVFLAILINTFFFLWIPLINILFFNESVHPSKKELSESEIELLVLEKPKEQVLKTIQSIVEPNPFQVNHSQQKGARSHDFQMDLSIARGEAGEGVSVGGSGIENIVYEAQEVDEAARILNEVQPQYPERAKKMRVSAYVKVYLVIDVYGRLSETSILLAEPAGYGFEEAVLKALQEWRFEPAKLGSFPVSQKATKEFRFVP